MFAILTLLSTSSPTPAHDQALTADNFESAINLANDFAIAGSIGSIQEKRRDFAAKQGRKAKDAKSEDVALVQRANKAVSLIYQLTERVPFLIAHSHLERSEAWAAYWSPIFRALATQCVNPSREIRYRAVSALQRTLLSEMVADAGQKHTEWTAVFDEVLFPLTLRLLKPEIYQLDGVGMNETRAQMGGLLCKVFLRYLDRLAEIETPLEEDANDDDDEDDEDHDENDARGSVGLSSQAKIQANKTAHPSSPRAKTSHPPPQPQEKGTKMSDIYIKTLTLLDRLMNAGTIDPKSQNTDALAEAVREGVKNTLLVMDGAGYLHRGKGTGVVKETDTGEGPEIDIWAETVQRLDRFLPGLVEELFPPESEVGQDDENEKAKVGDSEMAVSTAGEENVKPGAKSGSRPQTRDGEKGGEVEDTLEVKQNVLVLACRWPPSRTIKILHSSGYSHSQGSDAYPATARLNWSHLSSIDLATPIHGLIDVGLVAALPIPSVLAITAPLLAELVDLQLS